VKLGTPKAVAIGVLMILILIFALENNDEVEVEFLGWDWTMPRIVLIAGVLLVGFLAGWSLGEWRSRRNAAS